MIIMSGVEVVNRGVLILFPARTRGFPSPNNVIKIWSLKTY
jgi:hypothetical protein